MARKYKARVQQWPGTGPVAGAAKRGRGVNRKTDARLAARIKDFEAGSVSKESKVKSRWEGGFHRPGSNQ